MRNKNLFIVIGILVGLIVLAGVIYYTQNGSSKKRYSWVETYKENSKQPYGCSVIAEMLSEYFPTHDFHTIKKNFENEFDQDDAEGNYVFIGNSFDPPTETADALIQFVDSGNGVFISAGSISDYFLTRLYAFHSCDQIGSIGYDWQLEMDFNLALPELTDDSSYHLTHLYKNVRDDYQWAYFTSSNSLCEDFSEPFVLGTHADGEINFIRIEYGKGNFFLHTSPLAFSNIALLDKPMADYAGKVFSMLKPGDIWWDEATKLYSAPKNSMPLSQSPLKFILSQKSLRWVWYLIILFAVIYVLFGARRKQKPIPVIEPNTNSSLEFVNTISEMYYQKRDHGSVANHMFRLFLSFLRNRYYLPTNTIDEAMEKRVAEKSGVALDRVHSIFAYSEMIKKYKGMDDDLLIDFHLAIDHFYKNCK